MNEAPHQADSKQTLRHRLHEAFARADAGDRVGWFLDRGISTLVCLNLLAVVLDSVTTISLRYGDLFFFIEVFTIAVFTVEYLLRLWCAPEARPDLSPSAARLRYMVSFFGIVDLLAIAPFYVAYLPGIPHSLEMMRIIRFLWLLKLVRHSQSVQAIGRVFYLKRHELQAALFLWTILLLVSSSAMYYAERDVQPEAFADIPSTMWWSAMTMTTVGYGDVVPKTSLGRVIATVISVAGIAMFALPTAILGSGFYEELRPRQRERAP